MRRKTFIHPQRGSVLVVVIIVLLLLGLFVVGIVNATARDLDLSARRLETVQAFYAAEAGMNMAIRELVTNTDEDGDGAIGTISDDGNDANDPAIGAGVVRVEATVVGIQTTLHSRGRSGQSRRTIEAVTE